MRKFPMSVVQKEFWDVIAIASREPVVLTHDNRDRFVLVAIEDWNQVTAANPQRAYALEELPDDDAEDLLRGIDVLLKENGQ